jgi:hypothetical protein
LVGKGKQYNSVDELFGKIVGIERVMLVDESKDTIVEIIEKINLIPEHKLLVVEPVAVEVQGRKVFKPKVRHVVSITDVLATFREQLI